MTIDTTPERYAPGTKVRVKAGYEAFVRRAYGATPRFADGAVYTVKAHTLAGGYSLAEYEASHISARWLEPADATSAGDTLADLTAKLDGIRARFAAVTPGAWAFDREIKPLQEDIKTLLALVDALTPNAAPAQTTLTAEQPNASVTWIAQRGLFFSGPRPGRVEIDLPTVEIEDDLIALYSAPYRVTVEKMRDDALLAVSATPPAVDVAAPDAAAASGTLTFTAKLTKAQRFILGAMEMGAYIDFSSTPILRRANGEMIRTITYKMLDTLQNNDWVTRGPKKHTAVITAAGRSRASEGGAK